MRRVIDRATITQMRAASIRAGDALAWLGAPKALKPRINEPLFNPQAHTSRGLVSKWYEFTP